MEEPAIFKYVLRSALAKKNRSKVAEPDGIAIKMLSALDDWGLIRLS